MSYNLILHYERDINTNILSVQLESNTCHIPLIAFERWLIQSDKLSWVHDWSDESGQHCQETGEYTIEQYWDMGMRHIKADIYDFFVIHKFITPQPIEKSLNIICNEYKRKATQLV